MIIRVVENNVNVGLNCTENVYNVRLTNLGNAGLSAYQIAVANGFIGTEQDWLDSLGGSFTPSDYDLDEFTNESADPFVRVSEVPSVISKVVYCTLTEIGATDLNQPDIDDLVKAWIVSQNITKLPNEEYTFVLNDVISIGNQPIYIENYVHNYIHTQTISSNIWTINHNLNRIPNVIVTDFSNNDYEGDINYIDNNNLTITFSTALNGKATLT